MIPELRPYQKDANERVIQACKDGKRVIVLQAATGAGKSSMGADLVRRAIAKDNRVLFLVHRRKLVEQFSERLTDFQVQHGVLMDGHPVQGDCKVQVASRDTVLSRCFRMGFMDLPQAKLVIYDEGRHALSPQCKPLLDHYRAQGAYIVLLDATPVLSDGRGLGPWAQAMVCASPVTELIKQGYLCPVKCYAPDRSGKKGKVKRSGVAGDLVQSWKDYALDLPTVLFCSRVKHSMDAVEAFNQAGVKASHVDADTPDDQRDEIFQGLETGKVQVVSNVGIIKEGVDIPCLGCCQFFMDPGGRVAFLQGCGRIMRPHPGKEFGVLIDHAGAVFRHGFPDEDTEWTLMGNVDELFANKKKGNQTEPVHYCKHCELLYKGDPECPQCGRMPVKPPKSVFAPPDIEQSSEILTEADRSGQQAYSREEKVRHWMRCLRAAAKRDKSFGMALAIYKKKYPEFPGDDFPCVPQRWQWKYKVCQVYPQFKYGMTGVDSHDD
jgi:superfamily II DNA or RNA helicase